MHIGSPAPQPQGDVVEDIENINPVAGIMTHSQKKLMSLSTGLRM
jgi:hypothetical protein